MTGSRFRPQALQQRSRRFVVGVPGDGFAAEGFGTGMARFLPRVRFIRSTVVPWSFERVVAPGDPLAGELAEAAGSVGLRSTNCPREPAT
jgi:hypothetical protein